MRLSQAFSAGARMDVGHTTLEIEYFDFEHRGKIEAKNKGNLDMYF